MKTIEKIIAFYVLLYGLLSITIALWDIWIRLDLIAKYSPDLYASISYTKIFKNYHIGFLTSIFEIIGGLTLLLKKRIGYYLTLFICSKWVLGLIVSFILSNLQVQIDDKLIFLNSLFGFIFLTCVVLLVLPGIRKNYSISNFEILLTLILSSLFVVYGIWME